MHFLPPGHSARVSQELNPEQLASTDSSFFSLCLRRLREQCRTTQLCPNILLSLCCLANVRNYTAGFGRRHSLRTGVPGGMVALTALEAWQTLRVATAQ